MQPDNTRPSEQADTPEGLEDESTAFDPGDSFSNSPSDIGDPGELPSWLRNFAGSSGEPTETSAPSPEPAPVDAPAPTSWEAPDAGFTSDAAAPAAPDATPAASGFSAGADSGFFSEDDLPEWLRALSLDGQSSAETTSAPTNAAAPVTPGGAMAVPQVSRAWVTSSDVPEVSVGANLLSSLVSVVDSRPDVVSVESAAPTAQSAKAVAPAKAPASRAQQPSSRAQEAASPVAVAEPSSSTKEGWSRSTILLIVAIIVLLIILILFLS